MSGTVVISSPQNISFASGSKSINVSIAASGNVGDIQNLTFGSAQTIGVTPPAGATGVVITPPPNNLIALSICGGANGTNPIPLSPGQPSEISFGNTVTPAEFWLISAAQITAGAVNLSFF